MIDTIRTFGRERAPMAWRNDCQPLEVQLGGVHVQVMSSATLLDLVSQRLISGRPLFLASANLDHVHHFGAGSGRTEVCRSDDLVDWLVLLDGMPLVWRARQLTGAPCSRLAGADLFPALLGRAGRTGARFGVLGGSAEMHAALRAVLEQTQPDLRIAGMWSPNRAEICDGAAARRYADQIRDAGVDVLAVALGKPLQEAWLYRFGAYTQIRVGLAFGAACDFLAGMSERAPDFMRERGLEWLFRLSHEPRRLAGRYLVRGPADLTRLMLDSQPPTPTSSVAPRGG